MKRLLVVFMSLLLVLSLAMPVMANSNTDVATDVTVNAGGGSPPIIKCKWETPDSADPSHVTAGTQVLPSGEYQVDAPMEYYAVITDPEGVGTVAGVYADVWHPETLPECGSFKYQLELHLIEKIPGPDGNVEDLKAMVQQAYDDGLITFHPDYDITDVIHQIDQCLADVYRGDQVMDYHQPAGIYRVEVIAFDNNNNISDPLRNYFEYVPLTKCAFDFDNVNYGSVEVCTNKWVGGDTEFVTFDGYPTVRNLGNTNAQIRVAQDNMDLGDTSGDPNVEYDARLGPIGGNEHVVYEPTDLSSPVMTTIPGILELCNTEKLDFSIHVKKAPAGDYSGNMIIDCIPADWVGECPTPDYPDLVLQDIFATTPPIEAGEMENVTVRISNNGATPVNVPYQFQFSLDGVPLVNMPGPVPLAPGATYDFLLTISWPDDLNPHDVSAIVDLTDAIFELNETNNTLSKIWTAIEDVDLTVVDIYSTTTPLGAGEDENVSITVKNNGPDTVSTPYQLEIYLDGVLIVSGPGPALMAPGESRVVVTTTIWPSDLDPHEVKALVDSTDAVVESDETNNMRTENWTAIPGVADLQITKVADVDEVFVGENVTFTIEVYNDGPSTAFGVVVADSMEGFALDTELSLDNYILSIGGLENYVENINGISFNWNIGELAVGETATMTITVKVEEVFILNGLVYNSASVTGSGSDPDTSNNTDSITVPASAPG